MIFRKLLNNSIPKPILHYDFSKIADNKCPNKGSLGSNYDLQIEGYSDALYNRYAFEIGTISGISEYTVLEDTENTTSLRNEAGSYGWNIGCVVRNHGSFGLWFDSTVDDITCNITNGEHDGPVIYILQKGWNIITLTNEEKITINTYDFGGVAGGIITWKTTPIFNNCLVTGNGVYGKLTEGVNFTFNKDSGFSTVAVRELQQTATNIIWHKDKTDSLDHIAWEKYTNSKFTNDIFGESNVITAPEGTISYGTSKNYNGTAVIRGENLDDDTQIFRVGGDVDESTTFTTQRELFIWNRDLTDSQLQEYISKNIIPIPEVYYDVDKQQALNTDDGKRYLIDYSGHGHHGELKNFTYTDPVWTQISFNISSDYPSSGGGNDYNIEVLTANDGTTIFKVNSKNPNTQNTNILDRPFNMFNGYEKKITIAISGLAKGEQLRFYSTNSSVSITQILNNGNNIIDLSNVSNQNLSGYFVIAPLSGETLSFTNPIYIVVFPVFDESSANGWGYQQLPNLDSWVEQNTSIISKNKVKLTGTNGHYDSLTYSILPIYHDNSIAVFSPFKARFKVETTKESGQIGFAADGHVQSSGSQVVQGAYISYIDNGYVNVDFPGYIWDVSNLEMTTDPYLYCYPSLNNNSIIEQLPVQEYLTMNGDLNNQIDINSEDTYQTILVDMEVSEGGESELNNYNNNLTNYINFSPLYRTSKLYKYLAFKENLTDDQIQLAIDKYGFKYPLQLVFNNDFNNDFKWN